MDRLQSVDLPVGEQGATEESQVRTMDPVGEREDKHPLAIVSRHYVPPGHDTERAARYLHDVAGLYGELIGLCHEYLLHSKGRAHIMYLLVRVSNGTICRWAFIPV